MLPLSGSEGVIAARPLAMFTHCATFCSRFLRSVTQPFSADLVPLRRTRAAADTTLPAWTKPVDPTRSYWFVSDSVPGTRLTIGGYAVIFPDGPHFWLLGYWAYDPPRPAASMDSIVHWFYTPFRIYEDGSAQTQIWAPLQGGFLGNGTTISVGAIVERGQTQSPLERLVMVPNDPSNKIEAIMGAFPVEGYSGAIKWGGIVALVATPYSQGAPTGPSLCRLHYSLSSPEQGEVRGQTLCTIDGTTGVIETRSFSQAGDSTDVSGVLRGGALELQISRQIAEHMYHVIRVRGVKTLP